MAELWNVKLLFFKLNIPKFEQFDFFFEIHILKIIFFVRWDVEKTHINQKIEIFENPEKILKILKILPNHCGFWDKIDGNLAWP
jgi:hypothetical protein